MSSFLSWRELFTLGKWEDCAHVINQELSGLKNVNNENDQQYSLRIILENNKFVCDQLSKKWDCHEVENISSDWVKSHTVIRELVHLMHCQNTYSKLPLDVILCVTSNALRWGVMKVDPMKQHVCCGESLLMAYAALKAVSLSYGVWNLNQHSTGLVETDFFQAIKNVIPCLLKFSSRECYLVMEIIVLGLLHWLDEENHLDKPIAEFLCILNEFIDILPQMKVHISHCSTESITETDYIAKFGWLDIGEMLSKTKVSVVVEIYVISVALICLQDRTEEKRSTTKALSCLTLLDRDCQTFPALIHYVKAFAYLKSGKLEESLYHIQQTSFCNSNIFMQSRINILKGEVLLLQGKPAAAFEALQRVEYKHKEVQIPMCAYLISKVYGKLGKIRQQCKVLDLLVEYLSTEPSVHPKLLSPLSGMDHRILLAVHVQPEISYNEVLKSSAEAHLSEKQPKEAAERLMELLHITTINFDCVQSKSSLWHISELLHDTAAAFMEADSFYDAEQVCEAAIQFFSSKPVLDESSILTIGSLREDVIALILLASAKYSQDSDDVSSILNRCVKLLQSLIDESGKTHNDHHEVVQLCQALLARVYLQKALLNIRKKFLDDAIACFQRALHWKNDDPEVYLYFMLALLDNNKFEESLVLWEMYKEVMVSYHQKSNSIALNFLLGNKMPVEDREEVICRLQSLNLK